MVDTITGTWRAYRRRGVGELRAAWFSARARNALRHPWRMATIGGTVFVAALVGLVLVPSAQRLRASQPAAPPPEKIDTLATLAVQREADAAYRRAEAELLAVRARNASASIPPAIVDTFPPETVARRELLATTLAELDRLLARVEAAPLPASYRSLADARALRDDARVRALVDSLVAVEREREEFEVGAAVDPIYVALTTRATAIGRAIETIARGRRDETRSELLAILPPVRPAMPLRPPEDTAPVLAQLEVARAGLDEASRRMADARRQNAQVDSLTRVQRQRANVVAPPIAILAAALVLAVGLAFAITLAVELARPRVSDPLEVERLTGARVLAVLHPREIPPERRRRQADRNLPPILDPTADAYRLLTSHVSVAGSRGGVVSVTGDVPEVTAALAANIAAVSANDARSTMLVDADLTADAVARVLRLPPARGLAAVLDRRIDWTEATLQAPVGRDAMIDVLPAGGGRRPPMTAAHVELFRREATRLARRYDLVLFVAPLDVAARLHPAPTVLVCAHVSHTPLVTLKQAVSRLRDDGADVTGVVLWSADAPTVSAGHDAMAADRAGSYAGV